MTKKQLPFILSGSLLLILLLLLFILIPNISKNLLEALISDSLEAEVRIYSVRTNILSYLGVSGIEIRQESTGAAADLSSLKITYALSTLLRGRLSIKNIQIDDLDIRGAEKFSFPDPEETDSEDSKKRGIQILLDILQAENISVQNASGSKSVSFDNILIRAPSQTLSGFNIDISDIGIRIDEALYPIRSLTSSLNVSDQLITVKDLSLVSEALSLSSSAKIPDINEEEIEASLSINGDLSELTSFLHFSVSESIPIITSDLQIHSKLNGRVSSPRIKLFGGYKYIQLKDNILRDGRLDITFSDNIVELRELYTEAANGSINISGLFHTETFLSEDLRIKVENIQSAAIKNIPDILSEGVLSSDILVNGALRSPKDLDIEMRVLIGNIAYSGREVSDILIDLLYNSGDIDIKVAQDENTFRARGRTDMDKADISFSGELGNLESLTSTLRPDLRLSGNAEFEGRLDGFLRDQSLILEFKPSDIIYGEIPVSLHSGIVNLAGGDISVSDLSVSGVLQNSKALNQFVDIPLKTGEISYSAIISGTPDTPEAEFTLDVSGIEYADLSVGAVYLEGDFSDDILRFEKLQVAEEPLLLDLSGFSLSLKERDIKGFIRAYLSSEDDIIILPFSPDDTLQKLNNLYTELRIRDSDIYLQLDEEEMDLKLLKLIYDETPEISGNLGFSLLFAGDFDDPHIQGKLTIKEPSYEEYAAENLKVEFSLDKELFLLESLTLETQEGRLKAEAEIPLDISFDTERPFSLNTDKDFFLNLFSDGLDLSLLNTLPVELPEITGKGRFGISAKGLLSLPELEGRLEIENTSLIFDEASERIENINASLKIQNELLSIASFDAFVMATPLRLNGEISLKDQRPVTAIVSGEAGDMGNFSVNLRFPANYTDPLGEISLSDIKLSLLTPFLPGILISDGVMNARLSIIPGSDKPEMDGRVSVSGGRLQLQNPPFDMNEISLEIFIENEKITLESLSALSGNGRISAIGEIKMKDITPLKGNITVSLDRLRLQSPGTYSSLINGSRISYMFDEEGGKIDGNIHISELYITAPVNILRRITERRSPLAEEDEPSEFMRDTRMQVLLTSGRNIWLDNNLGRVRFGVDLEVMGSPAAPAIIGNVSTREGYLLYLDRKLQIVEGNASFTDAERIDPELDFIAETRIRSYRQDRDRPYIITLTVSGRASSPEIDIRSDPPLSREDIIALMTLGATRGELTRSVSPGHRDDAFDILLSRAGELTSSRMTGYLSAQAGNILNLDYVSIEGNIFNLGTPEGPRIRAQRNLTSNMALAYVGSVRPDDSRLEAVRQAGRAEITYTTGILGTDEQEIRLGLELTPRVSLESSTNQEGRSSIGLKYRLLLR